MNKILQPFRLQDELPKRKKTSEVRLILIRHGQTDWNLYGRYSGSTDIGLNATGFKQAGKLYKPMKKEFIDKVYSSDRKRAIETARSIFKNRLVEKVPDLREMHFGCFEGLTYKEVMEKYGEVYSKWLDNPHSVVIPRGESLKRFKKRVRDAFKKIVRLNRNKTVAAVCHGGTISIFITYILKTNEFWKYIPDSASVSIVEYKNKQFQIRLFNNGKN